jgi:molybdenum-dependent DNA-binding transcriptional regulator ModE
VRSKIWIEVRRRFAVGDGGIALLSALEETGSIREAASRVTRL